MSALFLHFHSRRIKGLRLIWSQGVVAAAAIQQAIGMPAVPAPSQGRGVERFHADEAFVTLLVCFVLLTEPVVVSGRGVRGTTTTEAGATGWRIVAGRAHHGQL